MRLSAAQGQGTVMLRRVGAMGMADTLQWLGRRWGWVAWRQQISPLDWMEVSKEGLALRQPVPRGHGGRRVAGRAGRQRQLAAVGRTARAASRRSRHTSEVSCALDLSSECAGS
jgi:hypothetical protein